MKNVIGAFILLLSCVGGAQNRMLQIMDAVVARAKETSMYSAEVDWQALQAQVQKQAAAATVVGDLKPAFETLLNGLRDHHGRILNAHDYSTLATFTDYDHVRNPDSRIKDAQTWKVVNDPGQKFSYTVLAPQIGYLKITAIAPQADIEKESRIIRQALLDLAEQGIVRWIVDLRFNGGGNMHPMMAGIAPLIGDGVVGGLVNLQKTKLFDWVIRDGNFIYDGVQAVQLTKPAVDFSKAKVAVLTGRFTVSSGEVVATTFKGRPNTRFFGEATGGYTTNNGWDFILDEVILNISTGIFCDRNGRIYEHQVPVDTETPFDVAWNTETDQCIRTAIQWLTEH